ncbi:acetyltransferase [Chitinophaga sp. CF418]|uniref:acetyltransferase n=1 Tax=Chitinophaga sp. CF418 TaxID=1855287 RepID=UPI00092421B3|nr:acetyltransferase [Chitinophaga sp. CF418]SHN44853.1 sugar O-acyltransferase, sialic acid O-acetyltransferase NeuD family [Chitinophaga sp. CF418]
MSRETIRKIFLYGAGGHAKVILELLELNGQHCAGIYDEHGASTDLFGYPISGSLNGEYKEANSAMIIAVGNNLVRKKLAGKLSAKWATIIHPSANISSRSTIGSGTVVMAGVSINSGVKAGDHVIINTNCSVDHDCVLADYVHISPNVALAGNVQVGEGTHVGIGTAVIQGIKIGKWATIGAGSVIIRDVPDYAVVVGNPGRILRMNEPDGAPEDK